MNMYDMFCIIMNNMKVHQNEKEYCLCLSL